MTTQTQRTSEVIAAEVSQLEAEISKLREKRRELAAFPHLEPNASPAQIAEKISTSVIEAAPRLRGLDHAIIELSNRLRAKQAQYRSTLEAEEEDAKAKRLAALQAIFDFRTGGLCLAPCQSDRSVFLCCR